MRDSGAGRLATWITLVPCVVLMLMSIALAGGPRSLLETIEDVLWVIGGALYSWITAVL